MWLFVVFAVITSSFLTAVLEFVLIGMLAFRLISDMKFSTNKGEITG